MIEHTERTCSFPVEKTPNLALALGSGGVRGIVHVGVYEVLHEAEIFPDYLLGCSAGSIIGACIADDPRPDEVKRKVFELIRYASSSRLGTYRWLGLPSLRGLQGFGFFNLTNASSIFETIIQARTFPQLQLPLCITAVNLNNGMLREFTTGELIPAILASSAVPGVFQPVEIDGHLYADGHILEVIPIGPAKRMGAKLIIAVNIFNRVTPLSNNRFNVLRRAFLIANECRATTELSLADVVIQSELHADHFLHIDGDSAMQLYEHGRQIAWKMVPTIRKKLQLS